MGKFLCAPGLRVRDADFYFSSTSVGTYVCMKLALGAEVTPDEMISDRFPSPFMALKMQFSMWKVK